MNDWKKKGVVYEIYVQSFNDTNDDGIGDTGNNSKIRLLKRIRSKYFMANSNF